MQRILFVDDEVSILNGLRRSLRGLRNDWDMVFAGSGAEALDACAAAPFDVVVSDARMPGMEGPELLAEVIQRSPDTVRFILSGQCSRGSVVKCVGVAHQFLNKPCESGVLKTALERIAAMRRSFPDETMRKVLSRVQWLPSPSSTHDALKAGVMEPGISLHGLAEIVAGDVALSAKVVQLVSSGFFGSAQRVTCPMHAALLLGKETVEALCSSFLEANSVPRETPDALDAIMRHSLAVGAAAQRIAETVTDDQTLIADAYLAGVLHEIGTLALGRYTDASGGAPSESWPEGSPPAPRGTLGDAASSDGLDPGAYLAALWGLAPPIVQAIARHRAPAACGELNLFTPLTAVHVANALLAAEPDEGWPEQARLDREYLRSVGCEERLGDWQAICAAVRPQGVLG